jgi:hypothetical protein
MSSFQAFFVGLGFGNKEALDMSTNMQSLALDFGAFNDLSNAESAQRFISALSGSSEVLDMFGINIKQAALDQELFRMGVGKTVAQATEQEKTLARINVIMRALGQQGAIGAAARESEGMAARIRNLTEQLRALAVELGETFMPMAERFVPWLIETTKELKEWVSANKEAIVQTAKWAGAAAAAVTAINSIAKAVTGLVTAYKLLAAFGVVAKGATAGVAAGTAGLGTAATLGGGAALGATAGGTALLLHNMLPGANAEPQQLSPEMKAKQKAYADSLAKHAAAADIKMLDRMERLGGLDATRASLGILGNESAQVKRALEGTGTKLSAKQAERDKFRGKQKGATDQWQRDYFQGELDVLEAQIDFLERARSRLTAADTNIDKAIQRIEDTLPAPDLGPDKFSPKYLGYGPRDNAAKSVATMGMSQVQSYLQQQESDKTHREAQALRQEQLEQAKAIEKAIEKQNRGWTP